MKQDRQLPFWQRLSLAEMNLEQWESLCDGCGKCCLHQLEDTDTGQLVFTDVACRLLDCQSSRCTDYQHRSARVPDCLSMDSNNVAEATEFAPPSCAYRLLAAGESLPEWHPLVSGDAASTIESGNSVAGRVISQTQFADGDLEDRVVEWPGTI